MVEEKAIFYETEEPKYKPEAIDNDKEVKKYAIDSRIFYPYLLLETDLEKTAGHKMKVLSAILVKKKITQETTPDNHFTVYLKTPTGLLELGLIHTNNLKNLLYSELYKDMNKCMMITPEQKVEGEMMYSYCTSPNY